MLILVFFLAGCGYTSRSLLEQNVHSVYVPIFDNATFRRGLEFELTKAIKEEILFKTRLKIEDKERADTILEGIITDINEHVLIENPDADVVESSVTVFVRFSWVDQRTGRALIEGEDVSAAAEFIARRNEDVKAGEVEAFVDVAEKIINLMEEKW
ncbi:MAG: LptE family protein [Candidatus Brocadiales bacterium]